jgi:hypothetical protein
MTSDDCARAVLNRREPWCALCGSGDCAHITAAEHENRVQELEAELAALRAEKERLWKMLGDGQPKEVRLLLAENDDLRAKLAEREAALGTEQSMHQAWRKRAEDAERKAIFSEYEKEMAKVIPEIEKAVKRRQLLAEQSKLREIGIVSKQEYDDALAAERQRREAAEAEVERLKALRFSPVGDNHHNAAECPYCGDPLRHELAKEWSENTTSNYDEPAEPARKDGE